MLVLNGGKRASRTGEHVALVRCGHSVRRLMYMITHPSEESLVVLLVRATAVNKTVVVSTAAVVVVI